MPEFFQSHKGAKYFLLHNRSFSSDNGTVTGNEFIRKVKTYGRKQGVSVTLNASRGKGSHQTLYFGSVFTIVRDPKR
jgi:mRNA interferase HicA